MHGAAAEAEDQEPKELRKKKKKHNKGEVREVDFAKQRGLLFAIRPPKESDRYVTG